METMMKSEEVRQKWAETIDRAFADKEEVTIMRYGRPIVTLVNHAMWKKTKKRLAILESVLRAKAAEAEIAADPSQLISAEEFIKILEAEGLSTEGLMPSQTRA